MSINNEHSFCDYKSVIFGDFISSFACNISKLLNMQYSLTTICLIYYHYYVNLSIDGFDFGSVLAKNDQKFGYWVEVLGQLLTRIHVF